jgi:hypothetical protein
MAALALGALGVVYGDIGTSPLYAVQAVFTADNHAVHATQAEVYGVISLVFWTLTLIVSVLYVSFIMRADDRGEGAIMSLTALLRGPTLKRTGLTDSTHKPSRFGGYRAWVSFSTRTCGPPRSRSAPMWSATISSTTT